MKRLKISEVLDQAARAKTKEERVAILKQNNSLGLRDVLRASFDDSIVFLLPEGAPPYKSFLSNEGISPTDLSRETRRFSYFVRGGKGDQLTTARREKIFLSILEGIHPHDAEVVCAMKDKKLAEKFPGITKDLIKEIWPKLIEA